MALKDTWTDLIDGTEVVPNSGDEISAEPINRIAHAVIELEDKEVPDTPTIEIDNEMSDTSENPVQNKVIKNYVDNITGDIDNALDEIIAIQNELIGGESV